MARYYRGGPGFARPENALKRAEELENVGQKQAALQALHDVITSRKNRAWSKTHEQIMFKHIDLCVEMKKRNQAKEALMQYRNMCQQVNINSLEEVIKYFLKKAGDKAEEAQKQADATTLDVEDLEEDASPEDLMLSYVSGDKSKDRTDRELVTPWFRFLWETYRSVLEILRTNPKLESLYTMTATRAFQFCQTYKRTAEFRRLCDILRQHLANMHKYREQRDISQPESLQLHLEARFEQLKVACELELWGEAFRSVEDIQGLIALGKKPPKQQTMAVYYAKLTQIFAVSDSHLYHAYSWLKLFNFSKAYNKNLTPQDVQMMACSVLLATLSIVPYDRSMTVKAGDAQAEQERERILRMANILGFSVADIKRDYKTILSRGMLLATITQMNLLGLVPPEVKQIFELLTSEFSPLDLCNRVYPLLEKLEGLTQPMSSASPVKNLTLGYYVKPLKQVAVLRALKQLSDVYSTMKVASLAALVPFATFGEVEAIIVDSVKFDYLQMQIDHRQGIVYFTSQQLESDKIRNHVSLFAKRLAKAITMIEPEQKAESEDRRAELRAKWLEVAEQEHKRALARKILIEKRKEEQETAQLEAEREAEERKQRMLRDAVVAEQQRRKEEEARREKERLERELEEEEERRASALLAATGKGAAKGGKSKDGLSTKDLIQEALNEKLKEQQELERKLAKMQKQMDHLERARREEEIPFLQAAWEQRVEQDRAYHEQQQQLFNENHRKAWEADIVEKHRLMVMVQEKEVFRQQVVSRREEEFAALKAEKDRQIAEKKAARRAERLAARKTEYVRRCREELEQRVEELVEQKKQEQEEKRRREREERQRQLDDIARKQREREEEIERRAAEERRKLLDKPVRAPEPEREAPRAAPPAAAAASSGGGGGGFGRGGYVPPHLRGRGGAPAADVPPAAPAAPAAEAAGPSAGAPPAREESAGGWRRSSGGDSGAPAERPADRWSRGGGGGGGGYVPPSRRAEMDRGRPGDDGPPRRDDGPPRREDGPPRRDDGPPRHDDGPPRAGGAYRAPQRRTGGDRW